MSCKHMVGMLKRFLPIRLRRLLGRVLIRTGFIKKGVLPASEAQKQITAALQLRSQGDPGGAEAIVANVFNSNLTTQTGLPREYIGDFLTAVEQRRSFVVPGDDDAADSVTRHTQSLDVACLPCRRWLILHWACIHNGLFKAGGVARENAIDAAYKEASDSRASVDSLVEAFKAAIDQGDFAKASAMLDRLRSIGCNKELLDGLQMYCCLNAGDVAGFQNVGKERLTDQDAAFEQYVKGKSLAIVGPAPTGEEVGGEIDSFDVVIRFTYRGKEFAGDPNEFGTRTDVSYVNVTIGRHMRDSEALASFDDLRFAVFKSLEHEFQKRLLESQRGRVLRANRFHFAGTAMALQHALFDLFHFEPRRVKLFHINFFLAQNHYHAGYAMTKRYVHDGTAEARTRATLLRWRSFANHGLVNQLNFVRNLRKAGLVEADRSCDSVLILTSAEYLSAMEEVWVIDAIKESARCSGADYWKHQP